MGEKRCLGCMERFPDKLKMCPYCGYVVDTPVENAVHIAGISKSHVAMALIFSLGNFY